MAKQENSFGTRTNKKDSGGLKKKILITGGCGFMGRHLVERFVHEGWEVLVIDDKSSQEMMDDKLEAKFYHNSITDDEAEAIFDVNNINVVIHLAERSSSAEGDAAVDNKYVNTSGLMKMLELSTKYHVKKFIYVSTASLFPYDLKHVTEETVPEPKNSRAITKYIGEQYTQLWQRLFNLDTTVVRLSTVYGPGQIPDHGFVASFMNSAAKWERFNYNDSKNACRDLLYVDDAVFAIYLVVAREFSGPYIHVSSGHDITFEEFVSVCAGFMKVPEIVSGKRTNAFQRASLSNDLCMKELGWRQKFSLPEGLKKTYEWYVKYNEQQMTKREQAEKTDKVKQLVKKLRPYGENLLLLLLVYVISVFQGNTPVNMTTGFDICYLYIICMGVLYGKKQSMPAVIFSIILLTWSFLMHGSELISILYPVPNLLHYSTYLFIGVLTGYVTDNMEHQIESERYKKEHLQERYDFLENTYHESIAVKDKLYRQIVNSDDSIGWLYKVIQNLDSVDVENIFTQAAVITRQIMNVENISIYVMGRDGYYMRQKVRFGDMTDDLPRSLKVETLPFRETVIDKKQVYANTGLEKGLPDLVAPIIYGDRVIAIIELFGMNFDQWSIYEQNLFSVTTRMISMSMGRAYQYEQEVMNKRYINGTRIMKEEHFKKIRDEILARAAIQTNIKISLIEFDMTDLTYEKLDEKLGRNIRAEDIIGVADNSVYMLLNDVPDAAVEMLMTRIENAGINVVLFKRLA